VENERPSDEKYEALVVENDACGFAVRYAAADVVLKK
jgi:hypothetical protein